jgi:hypothetical protein
MGSWIDRDLEGQGPGRTGIWKDKDLKKQRLSDLERLGPRWGGAWMNKHLDRHGYEKGERPSKLVGHEFGGKGTQTENGEGKLNERKRTLRDKDQERRGPGWTGIWRDRNLE